MKTVALLMFAAAATYAAEPPNPVQWTFAEHQVSAAPGTDITLHLEAEIEPDWHLYGLRKIEGGPIATTLSLTDDQPFRITGVINASPPISASDPSFGVRVEFYVGKAHFDVPVHVQPAATPGRRTLTVTARYQMCNDEMCLPPKKVTVELPVTITASPRRN